MTLTLYRRRLTVCAAAALLFFPVKGADIVTWDIDPASSYIRLTIPDQTLSVPDIGDVTFRVRDAGNNNQWTDAGGRRAALVGKLVTEYTDGESIRFLSGSHEIVALQQVTLRPNPAAWDQTTETFANTTTALAALGGRVRATYVILTFDVAFLAFRNLALDVGNVAPGPVAVVNGAFAPNTTTCGIAAASVDSDGLELPLGLGQPVPDVLDAPLPPVAQTNAAGGVVTDLGGRNRSLAYTVNISDLAIDLEGMTVTGSVEGQIVATTVLPQPVQRPVLEGKKETGRIVLSWPTNAAGFALEYTTAIAPANWLAVTTAPQIVADRYTVTNATAAAAIFYRLTHTGTGLP